MQLLRESNSGVIVGQLSGRLSVSAERNTVVDVQDAGCAAGRPNGSGCLDLVLLGVDLASEEITATSEAASGRGLRNSSVSLTFL